MDNKIIIDKLRKLIQSLWLLQFRDWSDSKFINWANKTKLYILNLSLEKKEEYLRKELINMLERLIEKMPTYNNLGYDDETSEKIEKTKRELQDLLRSFIETLELRGDSSERKWNDNIRINIDNTQFNVQNVDIKQVIKNTLNEIKKEWKTEKEQLEAEEKLKELEKELEKKSWWKNRETVKNLLKRFADFWKDVFIALIPAILKYYWYWE